MKWSHFLKIIKYIILLIVIALIAYLFIYISNKPEKEKEVVPIPVVVSQVKMKDVNLSLSTYAYVKARSMIPIVPLVSGEVKEHRVEIGDYVHKGDIISKLDDEIHTLNMQNALAAYNVALASYERTKSLYESGSVSKQIADEVKGKYEVAKGQYELASTQLSYTTIKSPISGTIISSELSVGSMGQSGSPVAVVSNLDDMVLDITLPSTYWNTIVSHKDDLIVYLHHSDGSSEPKLIEAKVETISPFINPQDASFTLTCAIDGKRVKDLAVGMYVKVEVVYKVYKDAHTISHTAITNSSHIYTYDTKSKRVTYTPLKNFLILSEELIVDSSLKDELIVVQGVHLLADNQIVEATVEGE